MAAHSRGSVKVLVQPVNDSLDAIAAFSRPTAPGTTSCARRAPGGQSSSLSCSSVDCPERTMRLNSTRPVGICRGHMETVQPSFLATVHRSEHPVLLPALIL